MFGCGYRRSAPASMRQRGRGRCFNPYCNSAVHGCTQSTWCWLFVCLSTAGQQMLPSTTELKDLPLNGLGERKVTFPKDGNANSFHETVLSAFTPLAGKNKILCSGEGWLKELFLIPMPPSGFSDGYLRSVLGPAKGYLRYLQRDVVLETSHASLTNSNKVWKN